MKCESGEDGECVGVRCAIAQGGSCEVGTQGTTRFRTREAPSRDTVTWVPSRDTATEYSHRALPQDTITGYRHRAPAQGTSHRILARSTDMGLCYVGLPRLNITAAYKQRHPG